MNQNASLLRKSGEMYAKADDAALLAAVDGGREDALRALYERHAPWLTVRLQRRCDDAGIVDEALQDAFLAIWRQAGSYDQDRGSVGAWLWGIAVRRLIDRVRRRSSATTYGRELQEVELAASAEDVALSADSGAIGEALSHLSPELQQVLRARVLDGLSTHETAVLFEIPVGTVKTRLMRAKQELRGVVA